MVTPVPGEQGTWADRAAAAERAVAGRFVRRFGGIVPGTAIGRVSWPRRWPIRPWPWHYWWQAHLLDCLADARGRAPSSSRDAGIATFLRTVRLRNAGSWVDDYYDDIAWLGLAIDRAGDAAGPAARPALDAILARLRAGHTAAGGGGVYWRRRDDFKAAPANGPAAILFARRGDLTAAAALADWMHVRLPDPETGLIRDGVRVGRDGRVRTVEPAIYTYNQGVYLGACVELAERDGHPRWTERATSVLAATATHLAEPDGVVGGYDDGGLFNGILARYLADAAVRLPELTDVAGRLVRASAESVWENRAEMRGGPVFAHDWRAPARVAAAGNPESALSVQLSGWMLLEAAARLERGPGT
ncbi:putative alpha-1,6-mannanase (GH76 family) [Pseudonocardia sediminis]|uniref:Putative alpha-1,6-mannanase (GH76 family) n=1 Tax=Pseudonocardia sediminis TaxID=1397368 RepID=A0A4Q7V8H0_PSEST|nr:glycoside hydrolase family 76 protein [Pseudonocardia sediminis]RZT89099.1 putative alpha-1,6-mannanase (GH76 family) [Pseudonocardia sediminis]